MAHSASWCGCCVGHSGAAGPRVRGQDVFEERPEEGITLKPLCNAFHTMPPPGLRELDELQDVASERRPSKPAASAQKAFHPEGARQQVFTTRTEKAHPQGVLPAGSRSSPCPHSKEPVPTTSPMGETKAASPPPSSRNGIRKLGAAITGRLRSTSRGRAEPEQFGVGEIVEYFSNSQNSWLQARVNAVRPDGTYDLDIKCGAPRERLRRPMPSRAPTPGRAASSAGASPPPCHNRANTAMAKVREGAEYAIGEVVEYYSNNILAWIPATVLGTNKNGTFRLDVKPYAALEKIRRPIPVDTRLAGFNFQVGELVEYDSKSQGRFIPAKVLAVNPDGTYRLDIKPDADPRRVRRQSAPDIFQTKLPEQKPEGVFVTKVPKSDIAPQVEPRHPSKSPHRKLFGR